MTIVKDYRLPEEIEAIRKAEEKMKRLQANKKKVVLFNKNAAPSELLERERELLQKEKLKKLKAERLAKERAHKKEYDRQYAIFK